MKLEDEEKKTSDCSYEPESEVESASDIDEKRRQTNQEMLCFDPEKQNTKYNGNPVPAKIPGVEINEKATQTASYSWMGRYHQKHSIKLSIQ